MARDHADRKAERIGWEARAHYGVDGVEIAARNQGRNFIAVTPAPSYPANHATGGIARRHPGAIRRKSPVID